MQVDLQGQTALVTRGAAGIGRAIAERLAANHAAVAIVDVAADAAAQTAVELTRAGGQAIALAADVADADAMRAAAAEVVERLGPIRILVNNAGINTAKDRRPIHEYSREDWDRILRVDLTGVFVTSQAVVPLILSAGQGKSYCA